MKRLALILLFIPALSLGATRTIANGGGNWNAISTWVEGAVPTALDSIVATGTSGASTINAAMTVGSVDFTGLTSSVTHSAAVTLTVVSSFTIPVGVVYSTQNATTSALVFSNPLGTATITMGGRAAGNITIGGAGFFIFASSINTTGLVTLTSGTLHMDGASDTSSLVHSVGQFNSNNSNTRTLNLGNSSITTTTGGGGNDWNLNSVTGLNFSAAGSTVTTTGAALGFFGGGLAYNVVIFNNSGANGSTVINGANTFGTLTFTGTASKLNLYSLSANQTITAALNIIGNSTINRILIQSNTLGTPRILTVTGTAVTTNNADFKDITFARTTAGNLDLTNGGANLIGDCGGNTRTGGSGTVTFTTPVTTNFTNGSADLKWSTAGNWSARVPLPQDDVTVTHAFTTGQSVNGDMPRAGTNISWTGATWTGTAPIWSMSVATTFYGSLTMVSGMSVTSGALALISEGRGNFNLTSAGCSFGNSIITIQMFGGKMTLQDQYTANRDVILNNGTLDAQTFAITVRNFQSNGTLARSAIGSGLWTFSGTNITANPWNVASTGMTFNMTGTIAITDSSVSAKTFTGGGLTYTNVTFSGDNITIAGNNTFNGTFLIGKANKTTGLLLTNASVQTFGTSGTITTDSDSLNKAIFKGVSAAATVTKPSGALVSVDFLQMTNVVATQTSLWYAGTNSTNNGGNTNWVFTAPLVSGGNAFFFGEF